MEVIWTEEAIDSFEEAYEALDERFPRSAARFADEVIDAVSQIAIFPESARMVPEYDNPGLRQVWVGSYRLIYLLSVEGLTVEVLLHRSVQLEPDRFRN